MNRSKVSFLKILKKLPVIVCFREEMGTQEIHEAFYRAFQNNLVLYKIKNHKYQADCTVVFKM